MSFRRFQKHFSPTDIEKLREKWTSEEEGIRSALKDATDIALSKTQLIVCSTLT